MTLPVGLSTGALGRRWLADAAATARRLDVDVLELSALAEPELAQVEALLAGGTPPLPTVVHAPARQRRQPEPDLVARLDALGLDVVAHPDVFDDVDAWRRLGARLLVENLDGRKTSGRTVGQLAALFEQLPDARLCLDVSHAVDAAGPSGPVDLAAAFTDRVAWIHVGCGCGTVRPPTLEPALLAAVRTVVALAGRPVPVVYERPVEPDQLDLLAVQLSRLAGLEAPLPVG